MEIETMLKKYNKSRIQIGENYMGYDDSKQEFVVYGVHIGTERFTEFKEAFERLTKGE